MITQFTIIMIVGLAVYLATYCYAEKNRNVRSTFVYLGAGLLLIPGLLIPLHYTHIFDDLVWYYQFRCVPLIEYCLILIAPLPALIAARFKTIRILFLFGFILLATLPYFKHLGSPLDTSKLKNQVVSGITIQTSSGTCGPSAVAALLRRRGIEMSERELAELCHTTQSGTEVWHIKRYLKTQGIDSELVIDRDILPPYPAIAGINVVGQFGHFISILGYENGKYIIGDSMRGRMYLSSKAIKRKISFTGFYLKLKN